MKRTALVVSALALFSIWNLNSYSLKPKATPCIISELNSCNIPADVISTLESYTSEDIEFCGYEIQKDQHICAKEASSEGMKMRSISAYLFDESEILVAKTSDNRILVSPLTDGMQYADSDGNWVTYRKGSEIGFYAKRASEGVRIAELYLLNVSNSKLYILGM